MNRTPTHTACTDAHSVSAHTLHSMITFHHANTRGSRVHSSGLHAVVSQKTVCHPRVMSRSLPRLTLTTSASSLSAASSVFPPFSPSQSCPLVLDPYIPATIPGGVADPLKIPSPTGHEPKVIQSNDLEPGRTELDRNLGSDLHQTQERIYGR